MTTPTAMSPGATSAGCDAVTRRASRSSGVDETALESVPVLDITSVLPCAGVLLRNDHGSLRTCSGVSGIVLVFRWNMIQSEPLSVMTTSISVKISDIQRPAALGLRRHVQEEDHVHVDLHDGEPEDHERS